MNGAAKNGATDQVTVLVFKDNFVARTFQVPLKWISKLGILLTISGVVVVASTYFAVRYYRIASHSSPAKVQELEAEILALQDSNHALQSQNESLKTAHAAPNPATPTTPAAASGPVGLEPAAVLASLPADSVPAQLPDPSSLPFSFTPPKVTWKPGAHGLTVNLKFAIQYTREDGGNQQGRIIAIARGGSTLLTYPTGLFNTTAHGSLIKPSHGEYFSVSRFREVDANFGPLRSRDDIKSIQVLILDEHDKLIYQKEIPVT